LKLKKIGYISLFAILITSIVIPFVTAAVPGPQDLLRVIGETIITIFGFEWIKNETNALGAFMRLCIWIFVFTLLMAISRIIAALPGAAHLAAGMQRNIVIVLGIIIATISTIFIPIEVLLAIGEVYSTVAAFIMFAILFTGIGYLYSLIWRRVGRFLAFVRFSILLLFWILLNIVTTAVEGGL